MNTPTPTPPAQPAPTTPDASHHTPPRFALIGVGRAGIAALENVLQSGFGRSESLAVGAAAYSLAQSTAAVKISLPRAAHEQLATSPELELSAFHADLAEATRAVCAEKEFVLIFTGLGGVTGTRLTPWLVTAVKAAGARAIVLATTPFDAEGRNRRQRAEAGWQALAARADGLLCLPGQRTTKLLPAGASVRESFIATAAPLAEAARGLIRVLTLPASIPIHAQEICAVLRGRSCLAFATAEASGAERARQLAERLLTHPLLTGAGGSVRTTAVVLSVTGWPEASHDELHHLNQRIESGWDRAEAHVGVAADESAGGTLRALLILSSAAGTDAGGEETTSAADIVAEVKAPAAPSSPSTLVSSPSQHVRRPASPAAKQEQLALEMVSRGRFEKSPPTIHKGEDLDVPTYIRRNITLTQN